MSEAEYNLQAKEAIDADPTALYELCEWMEWSINPTAPFVTADIPVTYH